MKATALFFILVVLAASFSTSNAATFASDIASEKENGNNDYRQNSISAGEKYDDDVMKQQQKTLSAIDLDKSGNEFTQRPLLRQNTNESVNSHKQHSVLDFFHNNRGASMVQYASKAQIALHTLVKSKDEKDEKKKKTKENHKKKKTKQEEDTDQADALAAA